MSAKKAITEQYSFQIVEGLTSARSNLKVFLGRILI